VAGVSAPRETVASVPRPDVVAASAPRPRRRRSPRALVVVLLVAAMAAVAGVLVASLEGGGESSASPTAALAARLPAAPASALRVGEPAALSLTGRGTATWAPVIRPAVARMAPAPDAPSVGRLATRTPEGTDDIVQVLARTRDAGGGLWVRIALATAPNGATGWVPRSAVGALHTAREHLVVSTGRRTATLIRDGRVVLRARVAVGAKGTPTPEGAFLVRNRLEGFDEPAYGPLAFGTSARTAAGFIGIHGTDDPGSVGRAATSGSIRMRDADIRRLGELLEVGTPVTIRG
jgi:lipoprotein-anchoring transpeptidase ErfK/SrfK